MAISVSRNLRATYRLQLGQGLSFERICALLPYFRDLGISHLYLSPCFKAAAGSTHGYDVVDPGEIAPHLGGAEGFARLAEAAAALGMGLVLDIVPNHMATNGRQNRWWWDVLQKGRFSRYADFFDIRWDHPDPDLRGKVLLAVLGNEAEHCMESGQIQVRRTAADIQVVYFDHEFPISRRSLFKLLHSVIATSDLRHEARLVPSLATAHTLRSDKLLIRQGDTAEPNVAPANARDGLAAAELDSAIAAINADPLRLKQFLDLQYYRLAYWRRANQELNYRRFFDIQQLAGLCVEKDRVFAATHDLVLRLLDIEGVDGLRIDHVDGLRDPMSYLEQLRKKAPGKWIVAEKILGSAEHLRRAWPVDGTTGYDFLNAITGLFIDSQTNLSSRVSTRHSRANLADTGIKCAKRSSWSWTFYFKANCPTSCIFWRKAPQVGAEPRRFPRMTSGVP